MAGATLVRRGSLKTLVLDFVRFAREHRKLWLLPLVFVLVAVGALLVFTQTSALAHFFYPLF